MLPAVTALCMAQTSCCTVKPAMTATQNIGMMMFISPRWVCLVWRSLAPWLDSTSVWIARWFVNSFPFFILSCCKAAQQRTYRRLCGYRSNPHRWVGTEWWCSDTTDPITCKWQCGQSVLKIRFEKQNRFACSLNKNDTLAYILFVYYCVYVGWPFNFVVALRCVVFWRQ